MPRSSDDPADHPAAIDDQQQAMDDALLFAGEPEAVAAFAAQTGLTPDLVAALIGINATVQGTSLTTARVPRTVQ